MRKKIFTTNLNQRDHRKFSNLYSGEPKIKEELFLKAFSQFKQKYGKSMHYQLQHAEIERVYSKYLKFVLFDDIPDQIESLADKFEVSRSALIREIICEYLMSLKN